MMNKIYLLAIRSEYFYNRLSLDLPHLSVSIMAIDAAEVRARIVREIEDQLILEENDVPSTPDEYQFSQEVLLGTKVAPSLPLAQHLDDCRLADGELAKELSKSPKFRHLVAKLRESYLTIWNFYREKSGPIPVAAVSPVAVSSATAPVSPVGTAAS